jgi:hypothetical protein
MLTNFHFDYDDHFDEDSNHDHSNEKMILILITFISFFFCAKA